MGSQRRIGKDVIVLCVRDGEGCGIMALLGFLAGVVLLFCEREEKSIVHAWERGGFFDYSEGLSDGGTWPYSLRS